MSRSLANADVTKPQMHGIEQRRLSDNAINAGMCLEDLFRSRVIAEIAAKHGIEPVPSNPRAAELVRLLLTDASGLVEALLGRATTKTESLLSLRTTLLEPAARLLGDMWLEDTCTEADIILSLGLLQSSVRRLAIARPTHHDVESPGRVLVALLPGETHSFGVALASDALHDGGWGVTVAFPASVEALMKQLRSDHSDALHLALSDVFRREEALPMLRRVVRMARSAAPDRVLRITVGGRMFAESAMRPGNVGADALLPLIA